jgi:hypothetical protein
MKPLILLFLTLSSLCTLAQTSQLFLEENNVRAMVSLRGPLFNSLNDAKFEFPKGSNRHTVSAASPWIGGISGGQHYLTAETYRQNGQDLQQGPVSSSYSSTFLTKWDHIFNMTGDQINAFKTDFMNHTVNYSNYPDIKDWPTGAPFVDWNKDGIYNPDSGDYPKIKGDRYLYMIMNDDRVHDESGSAAMKIEIHRAVYSFSSAITDIDNTIFVEYRIFNRSSRTYDSTYFGSWIDFDLGNYSDDFIGTDPSRNMVYAYNGDSDDEGVMGYGFNPPVQACMFMGKKAGSSISQSSTPFQPLHYYNQLKGRMMDGQLPASTFMYAGSPCLNTPPTEGTSSNTPGDRKILLSTEPFIFAPSDTFFVTLAFISIQASTPQQSMCLLGSAADNVSTFYKGLNTGTARDLSFRAQLNIFPNPAHDFLKISLPQARKNYHIRIIDLQGKVLITFKNMDELKLDRSLLKSGMYMLQYEDENGVMMQKLLLQ